MSERLWNALGHALYPPGLWRGPYWWRSLNAWWLGWWGWAFFYSKPWRPGSFVGDEDVPHTVCPVCTKDLESDGWCFECRAFPRGRKR